MDRDQTKINVSRNIVSLRNSRKMTQQELAEQLHYSDKAVSKWERSEALPDITVLIQLADFFNVSLQYLVEAHASEKLRDQKRITDRNHGVILGIAILLVWLLAILGMSVMDWCLGPSTLLILPFLYAAPVSFTVWLVFNCIWFNPRRNYLIISLLMWATLTSVFFSFLLFNKNLWLVFLLGIPGQLIIVLWSRLCHTEGSILYSDGHKTKE